MKKHRKRIQAPRKEVPRIMELATGVSLLVEARGLSTSRPTALRMNAVGPSIASSLICNQAMAEKKTDRSTVLSAVCL